MKISLTGVSIAVFALSWLAKKYGVEVTEGSLTQFVTDFLNVVSFIGMIYGQFRRKDVSAFVVKNGTASTN